MLPDDLGEVRYRWQKRGIGMLAVSSRWLYGSPLVKRNPAGRAGTHRTGRFIQQASSCADGFARDRRNQEEKKGGLSKGNSSADNEASLRRNIVAKKHRHSERLLATNTSQQPKA